mgnify:CR=1 FL=1
MTNHCDNTIKGIVGVITLIYLAFQIHNRRWSAIGAFVVISALMCCGSVFSITPCTNVCVCMLIAIIGSNIVALPSAVSTSSNGLPETFANHKDHTDETDAEKESSDEDEDENEDEDEDEVSEATAEGDAEKEEEEEEAQKVQKPKKNKNKNKKVMKSSQTPEDDEQVDTFSTFMDTYRSLTPDQVESMSSDTKDLISTQKALMQTVQSLAPVISQGKEMMDTFKDYFGPSGTNDLMKAFKNKKTV